MTQTLRDIFAPDKHKVVIAIVFAIVWHYYLLEEAVRQTSRVDLSAAGDFYVTNFVNALPYLETDNTFLKFLTFFIVSYLLVLAFSSVIRLIDNVIILAVRHLRKYA